MNPMSQSSVCKHCGEREDRARSLGPWVFLEGPGQLQGRVEVMLVLSAWGRAGERCPGVGSVLMAVAVGSARFRRENYLSGQEFWKVTCAEHVRAPATLSKKTCSKDTCYSSRGGYPASEIMF